MKYLFLLYGDTDGEAALTPEERRRIVDQHMALRRELAGSGALQVAEALEPADRGFVLRRERTGRAVVTDGPFIEGKEQLGSVYLVDCADRTAAEALAARLPDSPGLVVEVRPIAG